MPSQYGQDLFVLEVLGGMREGFFLDSGASDGVSASNTQLLEASFDWKGICVEPNTAFFTALVRNRHCDCLNCCLYERDGEVDFVEQANTLGGILDEYHPGLLHYAMSALRIPQNATGRPVTIQKAARTVRSVLNACGAPPVIDYWSLDTEGSEFTILKSFPFDEYSFRVLTVEHNWLPVREQIRAFLELRGYRWVKALEIDDCYVLGAQSSPLAWRSSVWSRRR
jgi:FkbM family methyltransferase